MFGVPSMLRPIAFVSTALVAVAAGGSRAAAQEGSGYSETVLSEQGFQVAQGAGESVPGGTFLLIAYVAFFGLVVGYVVHLARKQRAVAAEFGALRKSVEDIDDRLDELQAP